MSSGPETRFIKSVHRHLPPESEFYRMKNHNEFNGGIADSWYSGRRADLWIEWKFIDVPVRDRTLIDLVGGKKPTISVLQADWIKSRRTENRNVWVGVGCSEGCVLFQDTSWDQPVRADWFRRNLISREAVAALILSFCQGPP